MPTVHGGGGDVGGLVGENGYSSQITMSYSTAVVSGNYDVGDLVGSNDGQIIACYSTGSVSGNSVIGGLVGVNGGAGKVLLSYSKGMVSSDDSAGGLIGGNHGTLISSYSAGVVQGNGYFVGGLVGEYRIGIVISSFWAETSGQSSTRLSASLEGTCLTTSQMQDENTFLDAGWDFVGETANGTEDIWVMPQGGGYPVLSIFQ